MPTARRGQAGSLAPDGSRGACYSFPAGPRAGLQRKAFHDPREIVRAPTVTQDQCDRDGLRISARWQVARVLAEEFIDAVVDV